jgi:hypothetical protein
MKKDPKWLDYMQERHEERAKNEEHFKKQKAKDKKE